VLAFCQCDKIPETTNLKEGKVYFSFIVSEVSVPGHLTPFFRACGETEYHRVGHMVEQNFLLQDSPKGEREREKEKRGHIPNMAFTYMPLPTSLPSLGPSSNSATAGDHTFHT
jgi:hypothetical protein